MIKSTLDLWFIFYLSSIFSPLLHFNPDLISFDQLLSGKFKLGKVRFFTASYEVSQLLLLGCGFSILKTLINNRLYRVWIKNPTLWNSKTLQGQGDFDKYLAKPEDLAIKTLFITRFQKLQYELWNHSGKSFKWG